MPLLSGKCLEIKVSEETGHNRSNFRSEKERFLDPRDFQLRPFARQPHTAAIVFAKRPDPKRRTSVWTAV